jgi:hypothetical protein
LVGEDTRLEGADAFEVSVEWLVVDELRRGGIVLARDRVGARENTFGGHREERGVLLRAALVPPSLKEGAGGGAALGV